MRYLLDSQIWLWFMADHPKLSADSREIILDPDNSLFISSLSVWELTLKAMNGKLTLPDSMIDKSKANDLQFLSFDENDPAYMKGIPLLHKDPFDRGIMAQTIRHKVILLTANQTILSYDRVKGLKIRAN